MTIQVTPNRLASIYAQSQKALQQIRTERQQSLTLAEKILYAHLANPSLHVTRGEGFLSLLPDHVAMQDVTAQMALLQFMLAKKKSSAVPATVHCDHLIQAWQGAKADTKRALEENNEVFQFLLSATKNYGLGFWRPGAGIIHQVVLENYAFPGGLLIGTDSHTPNAGGLGMLAIGVGGADAADVMAGLTWELKNPLIVGVHLKGALSGWTSPKDVILKLLSILTVKGGTGRVIEYFGKGCNSLSCTGKATITNMGAELGATCSVFPYDKSMDEYLRKTGRTEQAIVAMSYQDILTADKEVMEHPHAHYDQVVEIDLSTLKPQVAGPHSPDAVHCVSDMKDLCRQEKWPVQLSAALIGSCTNSSYEDIGRAVHVAKQAKTWGVNMPQPFLLTPGSELIRKTIERDGFINILESVGAMVLANACGPCIGQWRRGLKKGQVNTIINSFNRNFRGRNDANPETLSFIASPETTMAMGFAGRLDFDPERDYLLKDGKKLQFHAPVSEVLPTQGFRQDNKGYVAPCKQHIGQETVRINPHSERLQVLKPFAPWDGKDWQHLLLLCKVSGKCTTDHISPAGFWLRYRGHLDRISDNLLAGAVNAFRDERGTGVNQLTNEIQLFSKIARYYQSQNRGWIIVGDENYGEGSSREHAAMTPRYLGCKAVIAKSFARIHETNLKKQGVLPFVFTDKKSADKVKEEDQISILGLKDLSQGSRHVVRLQHKGGKLEEFEVTHSLHGDQVKWFQAGSALNFISDKSACHSS